MKNAIINDVIQGMLGYIDNSEMRILQEVLTHVLAKHMDPEVNVKELDNEELIDKFIEAKRIEGRSEKTLSFYRNSVHKLLRHVDKGITHITSDDVRGYLANYQNTGVGKVSVDNERRNLSSFFSWIESEDYILKSPMRRIHRVKVPTVVKETYTDEELGKLRDHCTEARDLAMIDILASTAVRVGELVLMNREDIDFSEREFVVFGKGEKERIVYFDAQTKIHLQKYLASRTDDNPALFVSLRGEHQRLTINGVESRIRKLGKAVGIVKAHPHKFRRTFATQAIDKGMPIEVLKYMLGHERIDTTLMYAMVKQSNVKLAHRKYVG